MPSTIEEQIASYYGWVEERSNVSLRPSGTSESSVGIDSHGASKWSASVLGAPESGPTGGRGRTIVLAAAVLIGVVALIGALIAVKGDDPQRLVPTDLPAPATTSPAATIPATTPSAAVIEPDDVPAEQMSKIRTMVDAINTRNSDAFMAAFAPEGEFDGRGFFADSTSFMNRLQNVTQGSLIEAWMSFNDAWGLEAELKSCALQDVQPFWSERIDGIVKCAVATRWHTLSMEITEDWYFELDGSALLYWDSIGCCGRQLDLINLNPPERTLPLGYDGLEAWEIWLQTNDPDEAARLLNPRPAWPPTCEGCSTDLLAPGDPERAARLYPLLSSVENAWIIDGHPFTPAGLIPYDPALAQEIESSIQSYLENNSVPATDPSVESTVAIVETVPVVTPELFTEIAPGTMVDLPDAPIIGRNGTAMVWTGTEIVVWGGSAYDPVTGNVPRLNDGAALNLANGTWRVIGESPLSGRDGPAAAWTGTEMIVWGGFIGDDLRINDGAAYNPNTDTWRMLPRVPFAMGQGGIVTMVWTGDEAVISDDAATAAYNPVTDSWRRLDRVVGGADPMWTGNAVIWVSDTLTRWDVATDTWTVVPGSYVEVVGIPSADGIMRTFVALSATMGEPVHVLDESLVPIADLPPFPGDSALFDGKIDASANWVGEKVIFTIWAGVFPHEPTQVWALNLATHTWRQLSDAVPDGPVVVGDVVLAWGEENGPNVKTIGVAYRAGTDLSD